MREFLTPSNRAVSHDLRINLHSVAAQNGLIPELGQLKGGSKRDQEFLQDGLGSFFLSVYTWKPQEIQMTWEKRRTCILGL